MDECPPDTPWIAAEPLSELTLYGDWDSMASMVESLRIHLFDHGTIPVSNFMLCGGLPELSVPSSWAYTWPSLFAYALPANAAIVGVWLVMTCVGFASFRALLERWTGDRFGAAVGASLYVASGPFAQAFNRGHVTWAFFHLIPLMLLAFELAYRAGLRGRASSGALALGALASFLMFSGGLPHALFHLYPGFAVLVGLRVVTASAAAGWPGALRASLLPLAAHGLGLWLAAYKLWPVIAWQLYLPRSGVLVESTTLWNAFLLTLVWPAGRFFEHIYLPYIGPIAWLIAGFALSVWGTDAARRRRRLLGDADAAALYGLAAAVLGLLLSMGNGNPRSPAYLFPHLPMLSGIRGFVRYEVLTALGVSILVAYGLALLARRGSARGWLRVARLCLAVAAVGPVAVAAADAVWHIRYVTHGEVLKLYAGELRDSPTLVATSRRSYYPEGAPAPTHQTALLAAGHWISNCRTDLTLENLLNDPGRRPRPIQGRGGVTSRPPPRGIERISGSSLTLAYPEKLRGHVQLLLPVPVDSVFDPPRSNRTRDRILFRGEDLAGGLTVTVHPRGVREGLWASAAGVVATVCFFGALPLRSSRVGCSRSA